MKRNKIIIQVLFLIIVFMPGWALGEVRNVKVGGPMRFKKATAEEKENIRKMSKLVDILKGKDTSNELKQKAAFKLGKLGIAGAMYVLADNIAMKGPGPFGEKLIISYETYPAAAALIDIGKPAGEAVLSRLAKEEDDNIRLLCLEVLEKIDGSDSTKKLLKRIARVERDSKRKTNYIKAIELFEKK